MPRELEAKSLASSGKVRKLSPFAPFVCTLPIWFLGLIRRLLGGAQFGQLGVVCAAARVLYGFLSYQPPAALRCAIRR